MSYSETMTIPQDARSTLIRHRDSINQKNGTQIYFPRNAVRGSNQDITIKGTTRGVFQAKQQINQVLIEWRAEYDAFRQRQARRKVRRSGINTSFPSIGSKMPETPQKRATTGMFAGLESDVEDEYAEEQNQMNLDYPVLVSTNARPTTTLTGWNLVVAKGEENKVDISGMSWGDLV